MKRKILLLFVTACVVTGLQAQKKQKQLTGYAITAEQKGKTGWREVRLVDIRTGQEVKSIYQNKQDIEILNARTGKPVVKKDKEAAPATLKTTAPAATKKVYSLDANGNLEPVRKDHIIMTYSRSAQVMNTDQPFATNSAAAAYDQKHERLYYTPMSINQLRYIDLKSNKIYYFEDEAFGVVAGPHDVSNQITRMVFASDGKGYALSNNAKHLISFTTGKKPEITDLGSLSDDAANGTNSVHSSRGYGGDLVADAKANLYLITANRNVFRISLQSRVATFMGTIQGLPKGFSTNGAMVEEGSKVIVCSSENTSGYYRFDLEKMDQPAERASQEGAVFNASDLANSVLAFEKKKKERKTKEVDEETAPKVEEKVVVNETSKPSPLEETAAIKGISVYPNPVTNGVVKLSFEDQAAGKYQVQFLDMSGRLISSREVNIANKLQIEEFRLPELNVSGTYLVKIFSELNKVSMVTKLVVQ
jgi:hypothetical protein